MADVELLEMRDFLAQHRPWSLLPGDALAALPRDLSIRYLRRGEVFPPESAEPCVHVIRQGAVELRDGSGKLTAKLAEGDWLEAHPGLDRDSPAHCSEDTLLYCVPETRVTALRARHPEFDHAFASSPTERLRDAVGALKDQGSTDGSSLMATELSAMLSRTPVCTSPGTSVGEVARLMTEARVSSMLVTDGDTLCGLVTDRDLRSRCMAAGLSYDTPVGNIMTQDVFTVPSSTVAFRALMEMARRNIHHLPVVDDGRIRGMISTTDLIRREAANPVYLVGGIRRADSVESLMASANRLPEIQIRLTASGANARQAGEAVSTITDAITVRLLQLAERQLGPAPVPYLWVAGGSQARREQTSHSDQDNALILSDDVQPGHEEYFGALARYVNDGLHACGFVYCPGDVMASNPEWRQPLRTWRGYFESWIRRPEQKALMLASVFFDLRAVHGDESLLGSLQQSTLAQTRGNTIFLALLAANALSRRPPLGFFRDFVLIAGGEHDQTFDVKHRGIVPIVDLARHYALSEGIPEINTIARLRAAAGSASVSKDGARDLEDAWQFIGTLRLRHQTRQLRTGERADNFVAPKALSALERHQLKDAFRVIATMQTVLERRYPGGRLS